MQDVVVKKIGEESGLLSILNKMNIGDIELEMGNFKRYKKYEEIDPSYRSKMIELIKSGFDPDKVSVPSPEDDSESVEEAKEKREKLKHQLLMIQHYFE